MDHRSLKRKATALLTRHIATRDAVLAVRDSGGSGPAVVMLHSAGFSGAVFARQFDSQLARMCRLIAIDLPGHGLSENAGQPDESYSLAGLGQAIGEVLDGLDCRECTLFGWAFGGHIAIEVAATRQGVNGLMLAGTPPVSAGALGLMRGYHTNWDAFLASKDDFSDRDCARWLELCFDDTGDDAFLQDIHRADGAFLRTMLKSLMGDGDHCDARHFVETSGIPIAIVNGARDPFVRRGYVQSLAYANLWRGRCHLIPATGHAPFWYAAELVTPLIARFARDAHAEARRQSASTALVA